MLYKINNFVLFCHNLNDIPIENYAALAYIINNYARIFI